MPTHLSFANGHPSLLSKVPGLQASSLTKQYRVPTRTLASGLNTQHGGNTVAVSIKEGLTNESHAPIAYSDGPIAKFAIRGLASLLAQAVGEKDFERKNAGYDDIVALSRQLLKGRSVNEQRLLIKQVLDSVLPPFIATSFRTLFPPSKWAAEANAAITTMAFQWLVGEMELIPIQVDHNGKPETWNSGVLIKRCRYLEASGCKAMCANICKQPTQDFFISRLGFPITMNPNFEDLSCEMRFGEHAVPFQEDPIYNSLCRHAKDLEGSEECGSNIFGQKSSNKNE